ncbi:hypothetical protein BC829DRAFT_277619 [Chytridium lagenaria]|nr:hypothetical protein BC829DRAFT_277619 [Chytridium lagenaria]
MSAAGGDSASLIPSNRELTAMVRDNDEVEDEDDDDDNDQDASEPHPLPPQQPRQVVMDPTHPSLARMGAWQRSVADLIVRDQAAGTSVMSVSNSDGTTTMERGLTNRRSRLTNSSGSEGYRYPPLTAGAPPVPAIPQTFPQNLKPTRGDSLNGRPNNGTPPRPNYPMPVPLRPEQLQPPDGRVMKGPTIFGAAIAAGVHPTTPIIGPGGGGSRDGPSPASDVGDTPSPPLKKGLLSDKCNAPPTTACPSSPLMVSLSPPRTSTNPHTLHRLSTLYRVSKKLTTKIPSLSIPNPSPTFKTPPPLSSVSSAVFKATIPMNPVPSLRPVETPSPRLFLLHVFTLQKNL